MITSAAVLGLTDPLLYFTASSDWGGREVCTHSIMCMSVCTCLCVCLREKAGPPLSPALPNTSMPGSLKSGVQQHEDQGYSCAASLPGADRKGLMRRGTHHL